MNTCENCAHRYVDLPTPGNPNASGQSICRRYPPKVVIAPNGQGLTLFPPVSPQMACGEWKGEEAIPGIHVLERK